MASCIISGVTWRGDGTACAPRNSSLFAAHVSTKVTLVHDGSIRLAKTDLRAFAFSLAEWYHQEIGHYVVDGRGRRLHLVKA